jgi:phosphatidate cytidylyltransferase
LWLAAAIFWLALAPLCLARGWRLDGAARFVSGWLVVVPAWAAMLALRDRGPWWLLAALALSWVADIAAYFAGRAFGRHKLAPTVSPGKTWEGVVGAVIGVLVYAEIAVKVTGIDRPAGSAFIAVILLAVALSIVGDLFESLAKRQAGVKDSGRLLPGHGGILDRIDSQTSALPLLALAAYWWS